jgi:hypothetical protein
MKGVKTWFDDEQSEFPVLRKTEPMTRWAPAGATQARAVVCMTRRIDMKNLSNQCIMLMDL